jgi:hypothetical protein
MNSELLQDYLLKSGMNAPQAEALSRVFADMATKDDLKRLEGNLQADMRTFEGRVMADLRMVEARWKADLEVLEHKIGGNLESLEHKINGKLESLEHKIDGKLESLKADLTWRIIASLGLLATLMTLLNFFIG